jgi:alpha-mannosidase
MNQFAGVLSNATEAVADGSEHRCERHAYRGFQPAEHRPRRFGGSQREPSLCGSRSLCTLRVRTAKKWPAQISNGKIIFVAKTPSVGYAVYDVQPGAGGGLLRTAGFREFTRERILPRKTERGRRRRQHFRQINRQGIAGCPARLAISYDNPEHWPAWNMDWDQEQAAPKAYVGGPAKIRVVESGPARVAIEVLRETAGSKFVQTISLSAGEAGKRVEFTKRNRLEHKRVELESDFSADRFEPNCHLQLGHRHDRAALLPSPRSSKCRRTSGST